MSFISINDEGMLIVNCPFESRETVKAAGGRWDPILHRWTLALAPASLEYLLDHLPDPSVSPEVETRLREQDERDRKLRKLRAMSKVDHQVRLKVPGMKSPVLPDGTILTPYNYQKLGVMFSLANGEGVLCADEMGLGKTLQAIALSLCLKAKGQAEHVLIVTPASLKFNWPLELVKWTDLPFVVIDGDADTRIAQWLRQDVFYHVVNYEILLEDLFGGREMKPKKGETAAAKIERERRMDKAKVRARVLRSLKERKWDLIIVDEAHALKNPTSKRAKNVKELRARMRMALTGTPLDGRLEELHSVMEFVRPGLLESRSRFMQRHAETDFWGRVIRYRRVGEVRDKISPYFIRRLKTDVLKDLPDKIYENIVVTMSDEEIAVYKNLASRGHAATEDVEAMVAVIRCKQYCDAPELIGETQKSSKLEALRDVLQEVVVENGHKVLVFSQYAQAVKILMKLFEEMGLKYLCVWGDTPKPERASYQQKFNEDKSIDIMVGTEAMSTGLNFTAADYVINYDDNWAPAYMSQREDRAHRIGQKKVVTVVNFICKGTIEERIREVLYQKGQVSAQALGDEIEEAVLRRLGPQEMAKLL